MTQIVLAQTQIHLPIVLSVEFVHEILDHRQNIIGVDEQTASNFALHFHCIWIM